MTGGANSIIGAVVGACECQDTFSCTSAIDANGGIVLWLLIMLYMFKALGTVCDEYFVPSLEMISEKLELSNDVAGATFMAAGSSAPELFTSLVATFLIVNEGGVGAIIGSAIFNILVIVGATCLFAGQELQIWWYPLARDCSFYILAIVLLSVALSDSEVEWWEGLIMFLTYLLYILYMKYNSRIAARFGGEPGNDVEEADDAEKQKASAEATDKPSDVGGPRAAAQAETAEPAPQPEQVPKVIDTGNPNSPDDADEEQGAAAAAKPEEGEAAPEPRNRLAVPGAAGEDTHSRGQASPRDPDHHVYWSGSELNHHKDQLSHQGDEPGVVKPVTVNGEAEAGEEEEKEGWQCPDPLNFIWAKVMPSPERYWSLFFASITMIGLCTYLMVDAVNRTGCNLGISPLIMGLIFLAAGTSVPDALGSIAVAKQGEGDMAVANALGSNVFDILLGLGVPWFLSTAVLGNEVKFPGAGESLLEWILLLAAILVLFIVALVVNRWRLNRAMGGILILMYVAYVTTAMIRAFV